VLTLAEAADLLRVQPDELAQLAQQGGVPARRIGSAWRFGCAALLAWLNGESQDGLMPAAALDSATARGTAGGQGNQTPPPATAPGPEPPPAADQAAAIGEAPEEPTAEDVFLRGQRVLLGRGDVVLDVGQFYSRRDALQLAATAAGGVGLATVEQRALTTFLVGRVGVFHETEIFAATTFSRQDNRLFLGGTTLGVSDESAFGAASIGIRRTVLREGQGRPDIVFSVSGRIPKRDSAAAVSGGFTIVKSVDPVVMFASVNYLHGFEKEGETRIAPVEAVDLTMGYGLGLNDTVAISLAVAGLFAGATTLDGVTAKQPSIFSARFGLTASLAEGLYIEPSISFGLSGPGDSFAFGVTIPYAF
jgi:excisionase family DNA binding protein